MIVVIFGSTLNAAAIRRVPRRSFQNCQVTLTL